MSSEWTRQSLSLKDRHGWKSKPGYLICVIDRGAIRFDYPEGWEVKPESDSLKIQDRPDPDGDCIFAVSQMRLPREMADQVPIRELVRVCRDGGGNESVTLESKGITDVPRQDGIELAYAEFRKLDKKEKREYWSRLAVARGSGVYALITFDFWLEYSAKFDPVWQELLRSLTLGVYVKDPTSGPVTH